MSVFTIEHKVEDDKLVPDYFHVHHADSLRMMEDARIKFLESRGLPLDSLIKNQIFLVITSVSVVFKREIKKGTYLITCENLNIKSKTLCVNQKILNEQEKVAVEAQMEFKCLSGKTKRAVYPPEELVSVWK